MRFFDSGPARALRQHAEHLRNANVAELLDREHGRRERMTLEGAGLRLDSSRHLLDLPALDALLAAAANCEPDAKLRALCRGDTLNNTEDRPALHTLLRASQASNDPRWQEVVRLRRAMQARVERLHAGEQRGFRGSAIRDVVNIGIGGSDLGPRLVCDALPHATRAPRVHFVANIDPRDLDDSLAALDPASTLFVICSKSFTTEETRHNALAARRWLLAAGAAETDLDRHFIALTSQRKAAAEFGISPDNCLPIWDWVGGRYSLWSAVGLSAAIALGWPAFSELLAGARDMDGHALEAAPADNLPLHMSLLEIWCSHYLGAQTHAVLPYAHGLRRLPDFLQQLTMESNGKRVTREGDPLAYDSAPVLWGAAGTIGQHSFHQLLHQGTRLCPLDLVLPLDAATAVDEADERQTRLVANCLAQSRALMIGRRREDAEERLRQRGISDAEARALAPHLVLPGNRPHSLLSMPRLTAHSLGALLALYEHRTFFSSVFWDINAFDQWGVELGKEVGREIHAAMQSPGGDGEFELDEGTRALIRQWRETRSV
jgi:glucose-6-phosphate isomerase